MKIAQVAPLCESVPPKCYGGTERVVSYLTESLVKLGHQVTLYASGDSVTRAKLRPACKRSLRLDETSVDPVADHVFLAEQIFRAAEEFDLIHSHIDYIGFPALRRVATPHVTTMHGRLDIPNLENLFREFSNEPVISISNDQRRPLPCVNWQATVYHGIPEELYRASAHAGRYLAFLGRVSPEKRLDRAIEIARRSEMPLKVAAKVDQADQDYFESEIEPLLTKGDVEFLGEIGESEKNDFLANAYALLFPIDWPEPFGLVMIEAMACGTPVIAWSRGSVPEVIEEGITGYLVNEIGQAVKAVRAIPKISRQGCRKNFEERFTARRMAEDYLAAYARLLGCSSQAELNAHVVG